MAVQDQMLDCELAWFETELTVWQNDPEHSIRAFPQISQEKLCGSELPDDLYVEGAQKSILLNRYERNPKARPLHCFAGFSLQGVRL